MGRKTGRPPLTEKSVLKNLSLRESTVVAVEVALNDPLRMKPKYGSFSQLVNELLEGWLKGEGK